MLSLSTDYTEGTLVIALAGELDHHAAAKAMNMCRLAMDRCMPRRCDLDLSGLSFMDSSGIAFILKIKKIMRSMGGEISLVCPSDQPGRVIDASGICRIVNIKTEKEREKNEIH